MSEFRQDPASGEWAIIAPGRNSRPTGLSKKKKRIPTPIAKCPFEDLQKSGNWPPLWAYPNEKNWRIALIANKYPALAHGTVCSVPLRYGMYTGRTGVGFHDVLITRDHNRQLVDLDAGTATQIMQVYQNECLRGMKDPCVAYVVPFYNFGRDAGASLWHPHYQILAEPVVPAHIANALLHERSYFKKHRRCVRCDVIKTEKKEGKRVVFENKHAIALTPYASKLPYEVQILPKAHSPYFHKASPAVLRDVTALMQKVIKSMKRSLDDPDLNLFIHEAPVDDARYPHHHWHVELFPRTEVPAGFEFSTGTYINTVDPDAAAARLKHA
jgi:UDPglucose--hexose-1-phosphate uridylyltransferase